MLDLSNLAASGRLVEKHNAAVDWLSSEVPAAGQQGHAEVGPETGAGNARRDDDTGHHDVSSRIRQVWL